MTAESRFQAPRGAVITVSDHSCEANAEPIVDGYHTGAAESVLSATLGDGGVEVYLRCSKCGNELVATYTLEDIEPA